MSDIELVIKIPEKTYNYVQHMGSISMLDTQQVANAIFDGTPLPKGHDRLVEAHAVVKALFDYKTIDDVPTIIEADREVGT